jgi:hypothetical protein
MRMDICALAGLLLLLLLIRRQSCVTQAQSTHGPQLQGTGPFIFLLN